MDKSKTSPIARYNINHRQNPFKSIPDYYCLGYDALYLVDIDVSEEPAASTLRVEEVGYPPHGGLLYEI
jgi:hypothetical protein